MRGSEMPDIKSFRDLDVWRKAMDLCVEAYRLSKLMPKVEEFRLTGQLVRAAASVPSNIAEGNARGTRKDYAQFISSLAARWRNSKRSCCSQSERASYRKPN